MGICTGLNYLNYLVSFQHRNKIKPYFSSFMFRNEMNSVTMIGFGLSSFCKSGLEHTDLPGLERMIRGLKLRHDIRRVRGAM